MCGIAGLINFNGLSSNDRDRVERMADALSHRGPDARGVFFDKHVGLGHRRLSIIDLSETSNQPMSDAEGRLIIVFNGEIYNHHELRNELEKNYIFYTNHSDTETILNAYKAWGISALQKLNGMFAFALYDRVAKEVYIARDRIGEKPLYFYRAGDYIYFASEIQALFLADILEKKIDEESIYHYLTFLTARAPKTFYRGVNKLEAGSYLKITANGVTKHVYWDIATYLNTVCNDELEEACEKTELLLKRSMKYRNVSDVPVTIAASGGLDSSLNLFFSPQFNNDLESINISYSQKNQYNESEVAGRFSKEMGIPFVCRRVTAQEFQEVVKLYGALQTDMPLGSPDSYLIYLLANMTRNRGSKVLLVGEGGDEIGGYRIYGKLWREHGLAAMLPRFVRRHLHLLPEKIAKRVDFFYCSDMVSRRHIHGFTEYEKKSFWRGNGGFNSYEVLHSLMMEIEDGSPDSFVRKISNIEYKLRLPELILPRLDYPSMSCGVEARSPFVDHDLVAYSASLPWSVKMKNGAKTVMKRIGAKYLPSYVMDHPKIGFGALLTPFLQYTMQDWFNNELLCSEAALHRFVDPSYLRKLSEKHGRKRSEGYQMWILYVLNNWLKLNSN